MRAHSLLVLLLLIACPTARAEPLTPLGIGMEEIEYPHPVRFLDLTIQSQPVRMAYMDIAPTAPANGRSVVLLHGKNFWGAYWQQTITALSGAGYRVVVPDQIGFGKSSKPSLNYSFDLLAANTVKLLDTLGIEQAAIVGHSMGGMLAVQLAVSYPQRVSQLVLENPIGLEDYRLAGVPARSIEAVFEEELKKPPEQIQAYIKTYFPTWNEDWAIYGIVPSRMQLSAEWPRWAMVSALTYQMIYQQPVRHQFSAIQSPTLLIIGQADRTAVGKNLAPADKREAMGNYPLLGESAQRDIPGSKLIKLDGVGHIPHLQTPDRFHEVLIAFLNNAK